MPLDLPSDIATPQPFIPITNEPEKIPRQWRIFADHDALMAAVVIERANIAAGFPIWTQGEPLRVATEPLGSYRTWYIDTGLINLPQRAAASNAWRALLGNLSVMLQNDSGQLYAGSGAPDTGMGEPGEFYANYATGQILRKTYINTWEVLSERGPFVPAVLLEPNEDAPAIGQSFSNFMAARPTPQYAYTFGTSSTVPTAENGYSIKNLTDLAAHFDHLQSGTGATTLNSEMQVYREFNAETHQLTTDRLILRAKLDTGAQWNGVLWSQTDGQKSISLTAGATQAWDRIRNTGNLTDYDWRVGQVWCLYGKGAYVVTEMNEGVSFKLAALSGASTSGTFVYNAIIMTPVESAVATTATSNSATTIQFAPGALHANIQPGYRVCVAQSDRVLRQAADVWVEEIDHASGLVTLNRNMPISNSMPVGSRFMFYPRISSGQIWSKEGWNITGTNVFHAVEADVEMFAGLSTTPNTNGISGATAYNNLNNVYPEVPWGAWTAFWWYSHTMGGGSAGANEVDLNETWVSGTEGLYRYSTGVLGPGVAAVAYQKKDDGYTVSTSGKNNIPYSIVGEHTMAIIYLHTPDASFTYHYLDDVLVKIEGFEWMTTRHIQIGINVAFGWLSSSGAANLNVPIQTSHFARATKAVKRLRVWNEVA